MQQTIRLDIDPDGFLKIDAIGFSGTDCEQATAFLEEALGDVQGKQKKPEFYRQQRRLNGQQLGR
jgi:hypothetical protein